MQEVNWQSSSDISHGSQSLQLDGKGSSAGAVPAANAQPEPDSGEDLPSVGSRGHAIGKCKQCYYFNLPEGCEKGKACSFCHLHTKKCRLRPSKSMRALAKSQAQVLDTISGAEEMKKTAEELLSQNQSKYMQSVVKKKLMMKEVPLPDATSDQDSSSVDGKSGSSQDLEQSARR
eukprot:CAMPEP_0172742746 /NCGR_PEP_ID=MMETSP1074-20121228/130406_1 /TAXON_ID=2916 /ORGANISM="Ceratium fusus, Strain PA161109" /LENGTH=174 /DNA_ID=CAMNT_0013573359 /DNA_START=23 /DNA_END=543 /DNA_ORIENTATION=+